MAAARSRDLSGTVTLGPPPVDRIVLFGAFPMIGAVLGGLLPRLARWALTWDIGLPFGFLFRVAASLDTVWQVAAIAAAGAVAGLLVGLIGWEELLHITVSRDGLEITKDRKSQRIARADISAAFVDGEQFVILDRSSQEMLREKPAAPLAEVGAVLREYGYPWRDGP